MIKSNDDLYKFAIANNVREHSASELVILSLLDMQRVAKSIWERQEGKENVVYAEEFEVASPDGVFTLFVCQTFNPDTEATPDDAVFDEQPRRIRPSSSKDDNGKAKSLLVWL